MAVTQRHVHVVKSIVNNHLLIRVIIEYLWPAKRWMGLIWMNFTNQNKTPWWPCLWDPQGKPMVISSTVPVIFFGSWYFRSSLNSQNTIFLKQRISLPVKILSSPLVFYDSHIRMSVIQFNFLSSILHFGLKGLFFLKSWKFLLKPQIGRNISWTPSLIKPALGLFRQGKVTPWNCKGRKL